MRLQERAARGACEGRRAAHREQHLSSTRRGDTVGDDRQIIHNALGHALSGAGAHAETATVFAALDWKLAGIRPENAPHSVYQLLTHMLYWQEWVVRWFDGKNPPIPGHASASWPGAVGPGSRNEWDQAVRRFRSGLNP
jgi:hypothetical protein